MEVVFEFSRLPRPNYIRLDADLETKDTFVQKLSYSIASFVCHIYPDSALEYAKMLEVYFCSNVSSCRTAVVSPLSIDNHKMFYLVLPSSFEQVYFLHNEASNSDL